MKIRNTVEFCIHGNMALFSDPITRIGGEKISYQIPTYQALKGILESVYWKPTIIWYIDRVRIVNPIQTQMRGIRPTKDTYGQNDLAYYTYLSNVKYQVQAHFEWNMNRPELEQDRNENKHHNIARRMIERGGKKDIFLGTRECQGYVEACEYGEGAGAYDEIQELAFGLMVHGFDYPDETGRDFLTLRLWQPVMRNGEIEFIRPEDCDIKRDIRQMTAKSFVPGENFTGTEGEEFELDADIM